MSSLLRRASRVYREGGIVSLCKETVQFGHLYCLRPCLPRKTVEYNGVSARAARVGDDIVPWVEGARPRYESGLVAGLRAHVSDHDTVVVVGGGWGVTSTVAARHTGSDGHVITFEGSETEARKVTETTGLDGVSERVTVHHAVVAEAYALRGEVGEPEQFAPDELPSCDVLCLDCEGAERKILSRMTIEPETILVETHGLYDSSAKTVRNLLTDRGYKIVDQQVADKGIREQCITDGIHVLTARRRDQNDPPKSASS